MRKETVGDVYRIRFDSLSDMAEHAAKHEHTVKDSEGRKSWTGVDTPAEAYELARNGWEAELTRALEVAESAVAKVERELPLASFVAEFDVAGCEVDVARFLDGTPENMIDYPLRAVVKAGRVITLCASFAYSAAVRAESIIRQGQAVTALALALSQLGYSTEIWSDWTTGDKSGSDRRIQIRTMVKGPTDTLDPATILYAMAHPSMLRILGFEIMRGEVPPVWFRMVSEGLGPIKPTVEDLPEGTIYLPAIKSSHDVPDADEQLIAWLKQLEIVPEDD